MAYGAAAAGWLAVYMLAAPTTGEGAADSRLNVRIRGGQGENIEAHLRVAVARLLRPRCAAVLDDFRDSRGLTLREGLEAQGLTVVQHASRIFFYDGSRNNTCQQPRTLAYTSPNSHVVLVCINRFFALSLRQPRWADATLIHEILHTLGLGENPPTSRAITHRVIARCGET